VKNGGASAAMATFFAKTASVARALVLTAKTCDGKFLVRGSN